MSGVVAGQVELGDTLEQLLGGLGDLDLAAAGGDRWSSARLAPGGSSWAIRRRLDLVPIRLALESLKGVKGRDPVGRGAFFFFFFFFYIYI